MRDNEVVEGSTQYYISRKWLIALVESLIYIGEPDPHGRSSSAWTRALPAPASTNFDM